jgi:hypothetical protein
MTTPPGRNTAGSITKIVLVVACMTVKCSVTTADKENHMEAVPDYGSDTYDDWQKSFGWYGRLVCEVVELLRIDSISPEQGGRIFAAIEFAQRRSGY